MLELPSGTVTVLHTEIEGSTFLTVHLGDRYPRVLATHRALLRAAFAAHEGHEVDTQGDSFHDVEGEPCTPPSGGAACPEAVAQALSLHDQTPASPASVESTTRD